jgi:hypothetical protein
MEPHFNKLNVHFCKQLKEIIHIHFTRQKQNLYFLQANLMMYQKGVYYTGIKIFNKVPIQIKDTSSNFSKFKSVLKHFLNSHSFYTIEEYLR